MMINYYDDDGDDGGWFGAMVLNEQKECKKKWSVGH